MILSWHVCEYGRGGCRPLVEASPLQARGGITPKWAESPAGYQHHHPVKQRSTE